MSVEMIAAVASAALSLVATELARRIRRKKGRKVLEISVPGGGTEVIRLAPSSTLEEIEAAVQRAIDFDSLVAGILEEMARRGRVDGVEPGGAADFRVKVGEDVYAVEAKADPRYMTPQDLMLYLKRERDAKKLVFVCQGRPPRRLTKGLSNLVDQRVVEVVYASTGTGLSRAMAAALRRPVVEKAHKG